MENTSPAQTVVYLDLARTGEQFARRYSSEPDEEGMRTVYEFPAELLRPNLKNSVHLPVAKLAGLVKQTGAKVLIIDNLAFMQRYSVPRETTVVMRELRKIRDRFGLSILLLMSGPRAVRYRGIIASDIPCSSVVTSFADNVFAIGRSGSRSNERYIKHLKPGLEDLSYGEAHVPYFEISAVNGNFPSFTHRDYANEMAVRANDNDEWEWKLVRKLKEMSDAGMSIRTIAATMDMSRSTVQRRLQMAISAPPLPAPEQPQATYRPYYMLEKCIVEGCYGCSLCSGRSANRKQNISGSIEGHVDCPDDCDICGPRRYRPDEVGVDPMLKVLSDDYYRDLRDWLLAGKPYDRPEYPNAQRYGVARALWWPGSEYWTEEELDEYVHWRRYVWQTRAQPPRFLMERRE
ncbi:MAG: Lrp/AsnC family transcriptional regulator [bacterium]|nr:Lrp/AsnC family transcriptional regulator [bacterium]